MLVDIFCLYFGGVVATGLHLYIGFKAAPDATAADIPGCILGALIWPYATYEALNEVDEENKA